MRACLLDLYHWTTFTKRFLRTPTTIKVYRSAGSIVTIESDTNLFYWSGNRDVTLCFYVAKAILLTSFERGRVNRDLPGLSIWTETFPFNFRKLNFSRNSFETFRICSWFTLMLFDLSTMNLKATFFSGIYHVVSTFRHKIWMSIS